MSALTENQDHLGLTVGDIIEVTVTRLEQYGAWVDCGGRTGLILIPEISWFRISHPADILAIGHRVRAKVLVVSDDGQFSASIKAVNPELDPWHDPSTFAVGTVLAGRVMLVAEYGCFVELKPEVWGLLRRKNWPEPMAVGDVVRVRVESVDRASRKVEVSAARKE